MTRPTAEEIRRTWIPEQHWRELEEAEVRVEEAFGDIDAETGGDRAAGLHLLRRRLRPGWPVTDAVATITAHNYFVAYALREGFEPVPGERPGVMHRRAGGPLPPAEQRRLAGILGVPLELLAEEATNDHT